MRTVPSWPVAVRVPLRRSNMRNLSKPGANAAVHAFAPRAAPRALGEDVNPLAGRQLCLRHRQPRLREAAAARERQHLARAEKGVRKRVQEAALGRAQRVAQRRGRQRGGRQRACQHQRVVQRADMIAHRQQALPGRAVQHRRLQCGRAGHLQTMRQHAVPLRGAHALNEARCHNRTRTHRRGVRHAHEHARHAADGRNDERTQRELER